MHYEILDTARQSILPRFAHIKDRFYLAGGTALALHLGHRESVDFDFFSPDSFNTEKLFDEMRDIFSGHTLVKFKKKRIRLAYFLMKRSR
jgi:hypothetical protein